MNIADIPSIPDREQRFIASRVLGHRDHRSTRRYTEVTEEQVRLALAHKRRK